MYVCEYIAHNLLKKVKLFCQYICGLVLVENLQEK